jgi:hypothetical protein
MDTIGGRYADRGRARGEGAASILMSESARRHGEGLNNTTKTTTSGKRKALLTRAAIATTPPSGATMKIETLAIHAGFAPDPTTKAVATPIYQTTSYAFDDTQHGADLFDLKVAGNIYTRIMNPTSDVLEQRVAAMEGGVGALALASGMAAVTDAIFTIAQAGDNIVAVSTLYGGSYNLFAHTLPRLGIRCASPRPTTSRAWMH